MAACSTLGRALSVFALVMLLVAAVALPVRTLDEAARPRESLIAWEEEAFAPVRRSATEEPAGAAQGNSHRRRGRGMHGKFYQKPSSGITSLPQGTATPTVAPAPRNTGTPAGQPTAAPPSSVTASPTEVPVSVPSPKTNRSTTIPEKVAPLPTTEGVPTEIPTGSTTLPNTTLAPSATVAPNATMDANASPTVTPTESKTETPNTTMPNTTVPTNPSATVIPVAAPPLETGGGPRKPSWKDHPVYRAHPSEVKPPILAWFTTRNSKEAPRQLFAQGSYAQQSCNLTLVNSKYKGTAEANKLMKYDTLQVVTDGSATLENFLEFETTRDSQMCLVFGVDDPRFKGDDAEMPVPAGYEALGRAVNHGDGSWPELHKFASFPNDVKPISGYVACQTLAAGLHQLPSKEKIAAGFKLYGYNLLFSEADGSVPPLPVNPPGWSGPEIVPHRNCPMELHDMWRVDNHDNADPYTKGMTWQTWHPQRDYLYNCYYGHEHGSPGVLVGYTERFHYTAFKNNHQNETHEGFKGYAFPLQDYNMYMNIHSNTKFMGRVNTQNHTVVIAILDKSGKLKFEMSCKCNFGGSSADYAVYPKEGVPVLPMGNAETRKLITDMYSPTIDYKNRTIRKKRINLINPPNPDPKLQYESKDPGRGIYEIWNGGGGQYCMKSTEPWDSDGFEIDIKNPHTGCRDQACEIPITLGSKPDAYTKFFRPSMGTNRMLRFRKLSIAREHCGFEPKTSDGVFYTDQYCSGFQPGPGPNAVKQYMSADFKGVAPSNFYEISDVHGREFYQPSHPGGADDFREGAGLKGLAGFSQDQGALSYSVTEATF